MKTNLEVLIEGVREIAKNHGFNAVTNWSDGEVCIFGKEPNVPTLADISMLATDCKLAREDWDSCSCGVDIFITDEWMRDCAHQEYKGMNLWKRMV